MVPVKNNNINKLYFKNVMFLFISIIDNNFFEFLQVNKFVNIPTIILFKFTVNYLRSVKLVGKVGLISFN